jgi:hypothetical protein
VNRNDLSKVLEANGLLVEVEFQQHLLRTWIRGSAIAVGLRQDLVANFL